MFDRDNGEPTPNEFELSFDVPSASRPSPLLEVGKGNLRSVVALGITEVRADRRLDLLALETYESGAILTFRASGERRALNEILWLTWTCSIEDDLSTVYVTFPGGVGQSEAWRGTVLVHPAPPELAKKLVVVLRCDGAIEETWTFDVLIN